MEKGRIRMTPTRIALAAFLALLAAPAIAQQAPPDPAEQAREAQAQAVDAMSAYRQQAAEDAETRLNLRTKVLTLSRQLEGQVRAVEAQRHSLEEFRDKVAAEKKRADEAEAKLLKPDAKVP